ncbi:MAG: NAD-dependent epimerase/dehydratase family protein, partial [Desulfobacula sp.]|nr:NAD-dependent epimerase/dehydratase family protein [Desulfobacula sp.]
MNIQLKIYILGHRGNASSAISRNLKAKGYHNIITGTHSNLYPTNQQAVNNFFKTERPKYLFLAAAKVGGIPEQIEDGITGFL